ncbi:MAG: M56 family metallopeptidase [Planctomycetota bacterium]
MTSEILRVHLLQFSVVIAVALLLVLYFAKKNPAFAFVILMLAFVKCLLRPVLPSPTSIFAWTPSLTVHPEEFSWEHTKVSRLRTNFQTTNKTDRDWLGVAQPRLAHTGRISAVHLLLGVWVIGVGAVLWPSYKRLREIRELVNSCSETTSKDLLRLVHEVKSKLGIRQHVRVLVSDRNVGPGCIGVFEPALVIPKAMIKELPDRLLRPILAHELIHTKRRDVLWGYVQFCAQVTWWFHPLVWWLGRQASLICERSVDAAVIRDLGCSPCTYAESLVSVLKFKKQLRPLKSGKQLSAAEVTARRLLALRSVDRSEQRLRSMALYFIAALLFALAFLPGFHTLDETPVSLGESQAEILGAIQAGELDLAESSLRRVLLANPKEPTAVLLLGFLKQAQGDESTALQLLHEAASHPRTRSIALFSSSRLLAGQQEKELALQFLEAALDSGYISSADLNADKSFECLADNRKFELLAVRANSRSNRIRREGQTQLVSSISQWIGKSNNRMQQLNNLVTDQSLFACYGFPIEAWSSHELVKDAGYDAQVWIDAQGGITSLKGAIFENRLRLIATRCDIFGNSVSMRTTVSYGNGRITEQTERCVGSTQRWNAVSENQYQLQPALELRKPDRELRGKVLPPAKNETPNTKDRDQKPRWVPVAAIFVSQRLVTA